MRRNNCTTVTIFLNFIRNQNDIICKVIKRFLEPNQPDGNLLYVGNVVAQYFAHINKRLDIGIIESLARRLYKVIKNY